MITNPTKSKTVEKTLDPTWDEDLELVTKLSLKKVIKDGMVLEIKDKDTGMLDSDDLMGTVSVNLAGLEGSGKVSYNEAVSTEGVISFSVEWEEGETVVKKAKKAKKEEGDIEAGETTQTL